MRTRLHLLLAKTVFVLVFSLLFNMTACASDAQTLNPLYAEARDLWQQLSSSSISASEKAAYGKRFGDLAQEQKILWELSGQVDRGECKDDCVDSYNARIIAWQSQLTSFNNDVHATLESYKPTKGKWIPVGKFVQINVACRQTWACVPNEEFMHSPETKVVSTPRETVTGVCQVSNNITSCGTCTATSTPPKSLCEWRLEPR